MTDASATASGGGSNDTASFAMAPSSREMPAHKRTGRPTLYTDELAAEICIRIACGESLAAICRSKGMPAYRTVMRWIADDEAFRHNYARAREEQGNAHADEVTDIGHLVRRGRIDPQAARVAIDALKWSAGKRLPKKYGDRVAIGGDRNMDPIAVDLSSLTDEQLAVLEGIFGSLAGSDKDAGRGQGGAEATGD